MNLPIEIVEKIASLGSNYALALLIRSRTLAQRIRFVNRKRKVCRIMHNSSILQLEVDREQRTEIQTFLQEILPDEEARNFVLHNLAKHLRSVEPNYRGHNMIWFGKGANGKSVLSRLALAALGGLLTEGLRYGLTGGTFPTKGLAAPEFVAFDFPATRCRPRPRGFFTENVMGYFGSLPADMTVTLVTNHHFRGFAEGSKGSKKTEHQTAVVTFPRIFLDHPTEGRKNERKADRLLPLRASKWGPQFLLLLMEIDIAQGVSSQHII